ncbi:MAG: hypothetical protein K2F83_06605 [Oscillospiraceae bacterium]|nr:hypothetical protein [Oscillospiraceae bacterium]
MTTAYYTFNTRKVKVSGGHDMLTLVPVAQTEPSVASADGKVLAPKAFGDSQTENGEKAEILDFNLCRKHMETRNAWQSLTRAVKGEDEEDDLDTRWAAVEREEEVSNREPSKREQTMSYLELCATAAVIITALSAAIAFLSLV